MNAKNKQQESQSPWRYWRGLGAWNYYFLLKFALLWFGYLNFHPLANLVFLAFLLFPIPAYRVHRWRHWLAIPIGIGLLYHDTWLPGINSIMSQGSQITGFSFSYLIELLSRFINLAMIGTAFVILVGYLFISQWIRVTVFVVAAMIWLNVAGIAGPAFSLAPTAETAATTVPVSTDQPSAAGSRPVEAGGPPTDANLTAHLNAFYEQEKTRHTTFPASLPGDAQPFDLLVINICSLSWSDIEAIQLDKHPLWSTV